MINPTNNNPIEYKNVKFFDTFLTFENENYPYSDIAFIVFRDSIERMNGIKTQEMVTLYFTFTDDTESFFLENSFTIDLSFSPLIPILSNKKIKLISNIYEFLSNVTFKQRLNRYLHFIKKDGFLDINGYKLMNNGNILNEKDKFEVNFNEAIQNDLVEYRVRWHSLKRTSFDPYTFIIYKKKKTIFKFLGLSFNDSVQFRTDINNDVIEFLLNRLISKKRLV